MQTIPHPRIRLTLIGIGTGNPQHLTLQGVQAMQEADLLLIPLKGEDKADLAGLRRAILAQHAPEARRVEFVLPHRDEGPDYLDAVERWHDAIAEAWAVQVARSLPQGGHVALLVWGDPSLYDSSLRIAGRLGWPVQVIPGVTAIQALCAAHAIPLNALASAVQITTGRALRAQGWPPGAGSVVVMLDGACAFRTLAPEGFHIWWGAFLGMEEQIIDQGPLVEAGPRIEAARAEARTAHGWIMDCYLLRRL
ncbi:precorrin-6A synthase (deacetylating) [Paracoccus sp. (in: a-proteobacteria)]|uniref:precorrin-6A synthase (deacetylating) n=1 Tax=Paracoccus sp. TaxID=267 RepID=UPI00396CA29E